MLERKKPSMTQTVNIQQRENMKVSEANHPQGKISLVLLCYDCLWTFGNNSYVAVVILIREVQMKTT